MGTSLPLISKHVERITPVHSDSRRSKKQPRAEVKALVHFFAASPAAYPMSKVKMNKGASLNSRDGEIRQIDVRHLKKV
jgi:hypothetical protein